MKLRRRPTKPADIEAEIDKLHDLEVDLARQVIALDTDLAAPVDGHAALDALLDGVDEAAAGPAFDRGAATTRRAGIVATIDAARERRVELLKALRAATVEQLRTEARVKAREADERQAHVDRLLAQVSEFEGGATFGHVMPHLPSGGAYADPQPTVQPITQRIRLEAEGLVQQANATERATTVTNGHIAGARSVDELVDQVAAVGPRQLAPRLDLVHAWATAAAMVPLAKLSAAGYTFGEGAVLDAASVEFELTWTSGLLDPSRSSARLHVPSLADLDAEREQEWAAVRDERIAVIARQRRDAGKAPIVDGGRALRAHWRRQQAAGVPLTDDPLDAEDKGNAQQQAEAQAARRGELAPL